MPKKGLSGMSKGGRAALFILIGSALVLGTYVIGDYFGAWTIFQPEITPEEETEFSLNIIDGMLGDELPESDFDFTLYGTTDLSDWLEFEIIDSGTGLNDITAGDFDDDVMEDYNFFVVRYNGTVDHDDDLYGEDYDWGGRGYYERWEVINPLSANTLVAYQTPSDGDIVVVNTESFAYIDLSSVNVTTATNITIIAGTNSTQTDAIYIQGDNYLNEQDDYPMFRVEFNSTVALSDFSIQGTSKLRANSTTIYYRFSSLGAIPQTFEGKWSPDAPDIEIVDMELFFGDTQITA